MAKGYGLPPGATERDLIAALAKDHTPFWDLAGSFTKQDHLLADRVALVERRVAQCEHDLAAMQPREESVTAEDVRRAMGHARETFGGGAGVR